MFLSTGNQKTVHSSVWLLLDIQFSRFDDELWFKGGNRISQVVSGAHEGGIFSLCLLKDGTLVSGGGKDRRVLLWDHDYRKKSEIEVKCCSSSYKTNESFTDIHNEIQTLMIAIYSPIWLLLFWCYHISSAEM